MDTMTLAAHAPKVGQVYECADAAGFADDFTVGERYEIVSKDGTPAVVNDFGTTVAACCINISKFVRVLIDHNAGPALEDDIVNKPSHYTQFVIEPITFIMRNGLSFWKGNVIKYVCRAGSKLYPGQDERESEITDLRKVIRYCEMRINQLEGETIL